MNIVDAVIWWTGFLWICFVGVCLGAWCLGVAIVFLQQRVFNIALLFEVAREAHKQGKRFWFYSKDAESE